jgi:hypothetical protein
MSQKINVETQEEMNEYNSYIKNCSKFEVDKNIRSTGFMLRLYSWLFVANFINNFPNDFKPFLPGLEIKFALEAA